MKLSSNLNLSEIISSTTEQKNNAHRDTVKMKLSETKFVKESSPVPGKQDTPNI